MKRNISKALAILMALALVMSLAAMSASAVDYTPINGGTTPINKTFAVPTDANVPDVEFTYDIAPGVQVPFSQSELEIQPGPQGATIGKAEFDGDSPTVADTIDNTKKIAVDAVEIDLTACSFTAPGIYRYVITEQPSGLNGVTDDPNPVRFLDLFVIEWDNDNDPDTDPVLKVDTYSLRKVDDSNPDRNNFQKVEDPVGSGEYKYQYKAAPTEKSDGYRNELDTVDLEFKKVITGNQADTSKRFEFSLSLTDLNPGIYTIQVTSADVFGDNTAAFTATENANEYTFEVSGTSYNGTFYLTNNDTVKVIGLPVDYNYTLDEDEEDYTRTNTIAESDYDDALSGQDIEENVKIGITNTREGIIPTGVILTVAPFMIGLLLFGAVMMFMISRRRRATY